MRRALALLTVFLAALVVAAPAASAAAPPRRFQLKLHDDGFAISVESVNGGKRARLLLDRHGEIALYTTRPHFGADSVGVRFGRLGALDFTFTPDHPGHGARCGAGEQAGTFRGAFVFRGEHDYADIDAHRARGRFQAETPHCRHAGGQLEVLRSAARPTAAAARAGAVTKPGSHVAETGVQLFATSASGLPANVLYAFSETTGKGIRSFFGGVREERREGMAIERGAEVLGGAADFQWNLGTGTARLDPPAPFTGRAFYSREGGGAGSWRGSLRVPILGGSPMRLTGASFKVVLGAHT